MRLSMVRPTTPRTGLGAAYGGFDLLRYSTAPPLWAGLLLKSPINTVSGSGLHEDCHLSLYTQDWNAIRLEDCWVHVQANIYTKQHTSKATSCNDFDAYCTWIMKHNKFIMKQMQVLKCNYLQHCLQKYISEVGSVASPSHSQQYQMSQVTSYPEI